MSDFPQHRFEPAPLCRRCDRPEHDSIHDVSGSDSLVEARETGNGGALGASSADVEEQPAHTGRSSTSAERVHNRARSLAARWVREKHPEVWDLLLDQAAADLGIERQRSV
jgi:hypothetical protein